GASEALGGTRPIALLHPLRVLPAERREGDDSGVEPDVPGLGYPLHAFRPARRTADLDGVDPRTMELDELINPSRRQLLELGTGTNHGYVAAGAPVDGERQPEVAAAGDVPVAHIAEPIVHALAEVRRRPLHGRVRRKQPRPHLVHGNAPVGGHAEDARRVPATADVLAVPAPPARAHAAAPGEIGTDLLGRLRCRESMQPAEAVVEATRL